MKRMFAVPFVAALLGGAVVAAVFAAAGDLGESHTVTTTVQATPLQPSNASVQTRGLTPHDIYVRDAPGVAYVTSTIVQRTESPFGLFGGGESRQQGQATGSGIVIDSRGTILTNWHVVENAIKVTVSLEKGKTVEAQVIGKDPSNDLAVLRIHSDGLTLHPLALGNSSAVQVGDPVLAIGNPFDLQRTLTTGVVSALQRTLRAPNGFTITNVIQTDAPINPGNSGGPLLDSNGDVIGMNSQIESNSNSNSGVGFAISSNTVRQVAERLASGGKVSHPYLGVALTDGNGGATASSVVSGSPADKAGIKKGDVVTAIDGRSIGSSNELVGAIQSHQAGDAVTLTVKRAGQTQQVKVTLGNRAS
jgi:S1-C subfamily serine protease